MSYQRFLAELKRRKVFKVAAVYGVVAFVVVQVADFLFPALLLPDAMFRGFVVVLLLGFPIAIVLAWAFETTPEGIKRTEDAESGEITQIIRQAGGKRWPSGLLALAGAIMLITGGVLALRSTGGGDGPPAGDGAAAGAETPGIGRAGGADTDRLTIAALPFINMSGDDTSAVFTAGIHDDILTQLSKIAALRVTSRTSVREYEDTDKSVKEIPAARGVATVLEGGVRRAGNRVRINVQLIDAATDEHLWAETYDRELTAENVFEIQGEIARAVAAALEAELTAEEAAGLGDVPTRSLAALDAYHRGQALLSGVDERRSTLAVHYFERAVELDPGFGLAWAGLTRAQSWLLRNGLETDPTPALRSLARAREHAPDAPETHLAAGYYHYYALGDYQRALAEFEAAERGMPNSSDILAALGYIHRRLRNWQQAIDYNERAVELDPRNASEIWNLAFTLALLGDSEAADRKYLEALSIRPDAAEANWFAFDNILWGVGDTARAGDYLLEMAPLLSHEIQVGIAAEVALVRRDYAEAVSVLEGAGPDSLFTWLGYPQAAIGYGDGRLLRLAKLYRFAGDAEQARIHADSLVRLSHRAIEERSRERAGKRDLFGRESIAQSRLGMALAMLGERAEAIRAGEKAVQLYPFSYDGTDGTTTRVYLAEILTLVGEHERAIDEMEAIRAEPSLLWLGRLRFDPIFDPLRDNPRFQALLEGS